MKFYIYILLFLQTTIVSAQVDSGFVNNACGLFSPYQIDIERLLEETTESSANNFVGGDVLEVATTLGAYTCNKMSNSIYLALNLTTGNHDLKNIKRPLNICVVLDRSGSMQENRRMDKFKEGLKEFLKLLSPRDYISIVVYDDNPQVLIPSQPKLVISNINTTIDNIGLGGGTNIWAGMAAGYKEIEKHYSENSVNRLILMTDGISNVGVRSAKDILERSKAYDKKGIETTTMGLGKDINFDLLKELATQGKGLSHFIGDCENSHNDISNSLREELFSFFPVAKNIKLKLVTPKNLKLVEAYGIPDFESKVNDHENNLNIKDMVINTAKTILLKFDIMGIPGNTSVYIQTELTYTNTVANTNEFIRTSDRSIYNKKAKNKVNILSDPSVYNHYKTISVANNIKKAITLQRNNKNKQAQEIIIRTLREVETEKIPNTNNFKYIHNLLETQKIYLENILKTDGGVN